MSSEEQVGSFIAKFEPKQQALIRSVRRALRQRLPGAYELVYDNYNFFVIAYGPTERPSECVLSLAADANGVTLCLLYGATLPDPTKILRGSGKQVRSIRLPSAADLKRAEVEKIIAAAVKQNGIPFDGGKIRVIVRSISPKQRPRRKAPKGKSVRTN